MKKPLIVTLFASLSLLLPLHTRTIADGNTIVYHPKPPIQKLEIKVPPKLAKVEPVAIPVYVAPPAPVGVTNCGSDPNMAFIYQHESGCRTNAIGPNGPCGLGQALPCSKLPCSLSDWACQNAWFTNYAIATYGSTYAAYLFWTQNHWW